MTAPAPLANLGRGGRTGTSGVEGRLGVAQAGAGSVVGADAWGGGLALSDPEVAALLGAEVRRQASEISLVASESVSSAAVWAAAHPALAGPCADGLPGARRSGACRHLDALEALACQRAAGVFGAGHANVQPHAGAQAVLAGCRALCRPGETVLALDPLGGGHASHGGALSPVADLYRVVHYGVRRDSGVLDMDEVLAEARRVRPALLIAGGSAYPRTLDFAAFAHVASAVGARLLVDIAQIGGLVAAGRHPNPVPFADVVAGTTHKGLGGPRGGFLLCRPVWARAVDRAVYPGVQGAPHLDAVAAKAVCFKEAASAGFADFQGRVVRNAAALARALMARGHVLVSGGTDTHLLVVDLRAEGLSGRQAERQLEAAGLGCTRQPVPFDPRPPQRASGVRLGTGVVTARGMGEPEMGLLAEIVSGLLRATPGPGDAALEEARQRVGALAASFPLPA